jgi:hypothetical protein
MPTDIKLKNSVTATNAPTSLQQGEVAINITDKKVWVGNAATTPVLLLGSGADGTFTNLTVSGVASFADGTVSLPSITNIGDTNTGIFFPAADTIAFTEGGVESMRITSAGNVGIGFTVPSQPFMVKTDTNAVIGLGKTSVGSGARVGAYTGDLTNYQDITVDGNTVQFATIGTERMRIDSSGNVGIGTSSASTKLAVAGNQINFGTNPFIALSSAVGTTPTYIQQQNTSTGTLTIFTSGTGSNGNIAFQVGTGATNALNILSGGYSQFASTVSVGNASPSTSGAGITFPATQSASSDANTLDDYEEGTWTPNVGGTATYSSQTGKYTKIGNVVTVTFDMTISTIGTGSTNNISGNPFTAVDTTAGNVTFYTSLSRAYTFISCYASGGTTIITFTGNNATATTSIAFNSDALFQSGSRILGSVTYRV